MKTTRGIICLMLVLFFLLSGCLPAQSVGTMTPTLPSQEQQIQPSATAPATPTPAITATPAPFFTVYGDQPIVPNGESGAWDDRFTDPGAVIYHDGTFHMFRNGFRGFPAESQVGYVTSPDGFTWTQQGTDPVFMTKDVPYVKIGMFVSSVIVEDDGTWVLYFYTWDTNSFPSSSVIGRATASSPTGPWLADEEPVLHPGTSGAWDDKQVTAPHVIKTEDGYRMYYTAIDSKRNQWIGMATSTDGVHWEKYNDPVTTDKPFAESDPVFQSGGPGTWDAGFVQQPRVFQTANGWTMFYRATPGRTEGSMKYGVAFGSDGIHWERSALNPLFEPNDVPKTSLFWFTNILFQNGTYFLFVEVDMQHTTEIYLLTHTGELTP